MQKYQYFGFKKLGWLRENIKSPSILKYSICLTKCSPWTRLILNAICTYISLTASFFYECNRKVAADQPTFVHPANRKNNKQNSRNRILTIGRSGNKPPKTGTITSVSILALSDSLFQPFWVVIAERRHVEGVFSYAVVLQIFHHQLIYFGCEISF